MVGAARLPRERAGSRASEPQPRRHHPHDRSGSDLPLEGVATAQGGTVLVFSDGQAFAFTLPGAGGVGGRRRRRSTAPSCRRCRAGSSRSTWRRATPSTKGQKLLTLEAMKMEHSLTAPFDGMVTELNVSEGAQVTEGTLLVRIEKDGE